MIVPDQDGDGTLAMPTTVAMVKGTPHEAAAKKMIDFLVSKQTEQKLIAIHLARWSARGGDENSIKAVPIDYHAAAKMYARAQREASAIMEGRKPE